MIRIARYLKALALAGVCLLSVSGGVAAQQYDSTHLVVEMEEGYSIDPVNAMFGTTTAQHLVHLDIYLLNAPAGSDLTALADQIMALDEVKDCHPNFLVDPMQAVQGSLPISDLISGDQYLHQPATRTLALDAVHAQTLGAGVKVAVLDGGVNYVHPAFDGLASSGYDYVDDDSAAFDEPGGANSGHGTFVAGVIHLVAPQAEIVSYRVTDTAGRADGYLVAEAIMQAIADGCRVINLSMVMYGRHAAVRSAIYYGYHHDCVTVAAAGNGADSIPRYPAADERAVSVAALDSSDVLADFSCYGRDVDVCAPGEDVFSPYLDSLYAQWSGTSFAAPFVSGEAALITAYEPAYSGFHVRGCIIGSATSIDPLNPAYAGLLGSGLVDPVASLSYDPVMCADVDGSGYLDIEDLIQLAYYVADVSRCGDSLLAPEDITAPWLAAADMDPVPGVDIGDFARLFNFLYRGRPSPCTMDQLPDPVVGGSLQLRAVEGAAGYLQLAINQPITFVVEMDNSTAPPLSNLSNGFSLTSPDGAEWDGRVVVDGGQEVPIAAGGIYFSLCTEAGIFTPSQAIACHGSDADGFGAIVTSLPGYPPNIRTDMFRISIGSFGPEDVGKTLVLDSATFGNGGLWRWFPNDESSVIPNWDGPYEFTIVNPAYLPGDGDNSGDVNVGDLTLMIDYLFRAGPAPELCDACDVNGDCNCFNVADLTCLIDYLYRGSTTLVYGCSRPDLW